MDNTKRERYGEEINGIIMPLGEAAPTVRLVKKPRRVTAVPEWQKRFAAEEALGKLSKTELTSLLEGMVDGQVSDVVSLTSDEVRPDPVHIVRSRVEGAEKSAEMLVELFADSLHGYHQKKQKIFGDFKNNAEQLMRVCTSFAMQYNAIFNWEDLTNPCVEHMEIDYAEVRVLRANLEALFHIHCSNGLTELRMVCAILVNCVLRFYHCVSEKSAINDFLNELNAVQENPCSQQLADFNRAFDTIFTRFVLQMQNDNTRFEFAPYYRPMDKGEFLRRAENIRLKCKQMEDTSTKDLKVKLKFLMKFIAHEWLMVDRLEIDGVPCFIFSLKGRRHGLLEPMIPAYLLPGTTVVAYQPAIVAMKHAVDADGP